jgi:hypothetical protein
MEKRMVKLSAVPIALILCSAVSSRAGEWRVETVDNSGPGRSSSLKIDSRGNAHLAFTVEDGNNHPLKYAIWDGGIKRWFVMPVDQGVSTCSLALDSKQRPHIAYVDYGTGSGAKLRYAQWDGSAPWMRTITRASRSTNIVGPETPKSGFACAWLHGRANYGRLGPLMGRRVAESSTPWR